MPTSFISAARALSVAAWFFACAAPGAGADSDWPAYGGDAAKTRHSPLAQIHRGNVAHLTLAWRYDTGEAGDTQTQPIVVDGVLFGYTPTHRAFALDAATGAPRWT